MFLPWISYLCISVSNSDIKRKNKKKKFKYIIKDWGSDLQSEHERYLVEKHFTLDNNFSDFQDHKISSDPNEMMQLVKRIRNIEIKMGRGNDIQPIEKDIIEKSRRSIVSVKKIDKGHVLTNNDITWVRPGGGIPPGEEEKVIGKKLKRSMCLLIVVILLISQINTV